MFKSMDLGAIQGNPLQQYRNKLTSRICFQDDPPEPPEPPPTPPADFKASIPDDIRDHPSLASFKTVSDLAKSWVNVQPMIGLDKIPIPGKDSPPEIKRQAFHKLGLPEKIEDYKYGRPTMPEGYPMDEELEGKIIKKAHELGILPDQLKGLLDLYYTESGQGYIDLGEKMQVDMEKMDASLRRKWGRKYEYNAALADKVMGHFADDEFKSFLEESGLGNHPAMIKVMASIGEALSEDVLVGKPKTSSKTPDEAQAEIKRLYADDEFMKKYQEKDNPAHQEAVNYMAALQQLANPEE